MPAVTRDGNQSVKRVAEISALCKNALPDTRHGSFLRISSAGTCVDLVGVVYVCARLLLRCMIAWRAEDCAVDILPLGVSDLGRGCNLVPI